MVIGEMDEMSKNAWKVGVKTQTFAVQLQKCASSKTFLLGQKQVFLSKICNYHKKHILSILCGQIFQAQSFVICQKILDIGWQQRYIFLVRGKQTFHASVKKNTVLTNSLEFEKSTFALLAETFFLSLGNCSF